MKISICMAAHNRRGLLERTLQTIALSAHKDLEVICTDDASNEDERFEDLAAIYPFLKVIRVDESEKWWVNPCIPYNMAFKAATGDVVIIQNPENFWLNDIGRYVNEAIRPNDYLAFACYALGEETTKQVFSTIKVGEPHWQEDTLFLIGPMQQKIGPNGYYQHSKYRPEYFHFCSAITRKDLEDLGGFDERYGMGIAYEDNDFINRIYRKGMTVIPVDDLMVIHAWHPPHSSNQILVAKNHNLFYNITSKEKTYKVNN